MSDIVEVIIKTIDESSNATDSISAAFAAMNAQLKEMNQSMDVMNRGAGAESFSGKAKDPVDNLSLSITDMYSAMGIAKQGIDLVKGAFDATVGSVVSYDESIRSVSAATGLSAEETSKMLDLTDNFSISTTSLMMAQKNLAKEGYTLNIDTLKKLGNEYTNLGTQAERTTFLISNFGKSGMEFATMFDYGTAAMDKFYNGSADGMVRTKDQIKTTQDLTMAQKDLGDAFQGMINKVVQPDIPNLTKHIRQDTENLDIFQKSMELIFKGDFAGQEKLIADHRRELEERTHLASVANIGLAESTSKLYTVMKPTEEQLAAMSQGYNDQINLTLQIAQQTDAFTDSQNELAKKIYATRQELESTKGVYLQTGKHVTDLKSQLSDLQGQYDANAATNEQNLNKQIYADYLKMNSGKQLTYETYKQEQDVAVALGITTDAERKKSEAVFQLNQQLSEGKLTATAYAEAIKQALAGTPSLSGQEAAAQWQKDHPTSTPAATEPATTTPAATGTSGAAAGTGQAQAQAWLDAQKQAKATEDAAKKATSAMASDFTTYSSTVTKQADTAQKSVKELLDQLTAIKDLGSFTITVTSNTNSTGTGGAEYP